ncbi:hypothetical protein [Parabacteroides sp. PF5-9]|uniref:hypothetical protein n=1 Tax=Parabacteroides sp. PF5-9 TaxID=1742404 RepID=UPI0024766A6A|nr:hypothetical protein [Parabacteroides sp. PF5-9]MDH6359218.1 hypothetical protein [Parabacteroides sp. PF5-9]
MRTTKLPHILVVVFSCILNACVTPEMYNGEDPGPDPTPGDNKKGALAVSPDWSNRSMNVPTPSQFIVSLNNNEYKATFGSGQTDFPDSIKVGNYNLQLYNEASQIQVSHSTASVDGVSGGGIYASPGWFFGAYQAIEIKAEEKTQVTPIMRQLVKQLTITINVEDGGMPRILTAAGTLSGVASAVDFSSTPGLLKSPASVSFSFTKNDELNQLIGVVRLMGVIGSEQNLQVNLTLVNGTTWEPFVSDMSSALSNFNNDMITPQELTNTISLGVNPDVSGFIHDWEEAFDNITIKY